MSSQPQTLVTPEDYLAHERKAEHRSEYWNGEMVAMSGASFVHNVIVANVVGELRSQLKKSSCTVVPSDMRVYVESALRYVYPDVVVVCGDPEFTDDEHDTLVNPALIVEVLSKTTKDYDRGEKFLRYRTLPSLKEYVLISQDRPFVEHYVKQAGEKWLLSEVHGLEATLSLDSIDGRLELAEVYDKVELSQASLRVVE